MPFESDPLDVTFLDGHHWKLTSALRWKDQDKGWLVTVPAGFTTDFASVPRGLWNVFPPAGRYAPAAVLHDFLYQTGKVIDVTMDPSTIVISRAYADSVLRRASGDLGVSRFVRNWMWMGVRAAGWFIWKKYREADAGGVA